MVNGSVAKMIWQLLLNCAGISVLKMNEHEKINYVEFPAKDIEATKAFFKAVFNWSFEDYGPEYTAFSNAGIDGGFYKSELKCIYSEW